MSTCETLSRQSQNVYLGKSCTVRTNRHRCHDLYAINNINPPAPFINSLVNYYHWPLLRHCAVHIVNSTDTKINYAFSCVDDKFFAEPWVVIVLSRRDSQPRRISNNINFLIGGLQFSINNCQFFFTM